MPASPTLDNPKNDSLKVRIDSARSALYAARERLDILKRESVELQQRVQEQYEELLAARMKQWILMSEIKMHCLKGMAVCSVAAGACGAPGSRPYGHLVQ